MNFAIQVLLANGSWDSFDWYTVKSSAKAALIRYQSNHPSRSYRLVKEYE